MATFRRWARFALLAGLGLLPVLSSGLLVHSHAAPLGAGVVLEQAAAPAPAYHGCALCRLASRADPGATPLVGPVAASPAQGASAFAPATSLPVGIASGRPAARAPPLSRV